MSKPDRCTDCGREVHKVCGVCQKPKCWLCWTDDKGEDWCPDCKSRYEEYMAPEWAREREEG